MRRLHGRRARHSAIMEPSTPPLVMSVGLRSTRDAECRVLTLSSAEHFESRLASSRLVIPDAVKVGGVTAGALCDLSPRILASALARASVPECWRKAGDEGCRLAVLTRRRLAEAFKDHHLGPCRRLVSHRSASRVMRARAILPGMQSMSENCVSAVCVGLSDSQQPLACFSMRIRCSVSDRFASGAESKDAELRRSIGLPIHPIHPAYRLLAAASSCVSFCDPRCEESGLMEVNSAEKAINHFEVMMMVKQVPIFRERRSAKPVIPSGLAVAGRTGASPSEVSALWLHPRFVAGTSI